MEVAVLQSRKLLGCWRGQVILGDPIGKQRDLLAEFASTVHPGRVARPSAIRPRQVVNVGQRSRSERRWQPAARSENAAAVDRGAVLDVLGQGDQ